MIKTVDITKALQIQGWMAESELTWLAERASEHSCIVEVGSYHGRSTRALGDNCPGTIYAVDTWTGPIGADQREALPNFYQKFEDNLGDLIEKGKVIPLTPEEVETRLQEFPSMVFIDADHTYEGVKKDILYWSKKIRNGIICGHDAQYTGIQKAVIEIYGPDVLVAPGTTIWHVSINT